LELIKELFMKTRLFCLIPVMAIAVVFHPLAAAITLAEDSCPSEYTAREASPVFYAACPSGYTDKGSIDAVDYYDSQGQKNTDNTGTFEITQCSH
jgi:hypothetical protein